MKKICSWCKAVLCEATDPTVLEVSHGICQTCSDKLEADGERLTAAVPRRITLGDLTLKLREYNRTVTPAGSDCTCNAWQDYMQDVADKLCGCDNGLRDCDHGHLTVPRDFGWFWLSVAEGKSSKYKPATGAAVWG